MSKGALEIPGYLAAVEQEQIVRDAAFLPVVENVNGFPLLPMTLRHYVALRVIRSPMLPPFQTPSPADLAAFLWLLNPGYCLDARKRAEFVRVCRRRFMVAGRWTRKGRFDALECAAETVNACRAFVTEAMQDRPPRSESVTQSKDYYSDAASICAALAREYGWTDEDVLDKPLKRLFQYVKEIGEHNALKNGETPMLCNPSDGIIGRHLQAINKRN